jgi:hypothetical protein
MTVKEALRSDSSKEAVLAIADELSSMEKMNVYTYIQPTKDIHAISSKMFIKQKYDADGKPTIMKARLAARGDQWYGPIDEDVSSPTVDQASINVVLDIAANYQCRVISCDIPKAYLQSNNLEKKIYMKLSKDVSEILITEKPNLRKYIYNQEIYVKLNKPLYGLKEAGIMWYDTIKSYLITIGYKPSVTDRCIFVKRQGVHFTIICMHVDDLLIVGNDDGTLEELKKQLTLEYGVKEFQENNISYLNMHIKQSSNRKTIHVSQEGYVSSLISKYMMPDSNNVAKTPSLKDLFTSDSEEKFEYKAFFLSAIMTLMYVAKRTRPDILKEVVFLATKASDPTIADMNKLIRILKYLNGTIKYGIQFTWQKDQNYYAFIDASYNVHSDGKGHSGIVIQRGISGGPIFIKSSKQKLVAKSSTESELIALYDGAKFVEWIRNLSSELGFGIDKPIIIYQDNKSTMLIAEKGTGSFGKTKHINIRYFSIKDLIVKKTIALQHLSTKDMLADILTKPIVGSDFNRMRDRLVGPHN